MLGYCPRKCFKWFATFIVLCLPVLGQETGTTSDSKTILFVDDHSVMYRPGTKRILRPLDHHPDNPLIPDDLPWEKTIAYCSVHRDHTGRYQLWYQAYRGELGACVCYATSDDGIVWTKPMMDHFPIDGKPTNIVLTGLGHYGAAVLYDPRDSDSARRYKMVFWEDPEDKGYGLGVGFSPDGIHWEKYPEIPLLKAFPGVVHTVSDVNDVMFDPVREMFVIYGKTWIDGHTGEQWKRAIVRSESRDFLHWSQPQLMMAPDEFDGWEGDDLELETSGVGGGSKGIQLHGGPVFYYQGVYFGLLQKMDARLSGRMPGELAISRDGLNWDRPFRDRPFIPVPDQDSFGSLVWSNATPVFLEDEVRFYFGAYSGRWSGGKKNFLSKPTGVGMASMPLDRFAGIRPIEKIGQITLQPMLIENVAALSLNADATSGAIRMEILNSNGWKLEGYTREESEVIQGNHLRHPVAWKTKRITDLPGGTYWLRIYLENDATVYALTLEN